MPWDCEDCGTSSPDDIGVCPACGHAKAAWTVTGDQTRALVVTRRRLELSRGVGAAPLTGTPDWAALERVPAEDAPVTHKSAVAALAAAGVLPAPEQLLLARFSPGGEREPLLSIAVAYAGRSRA